MVKLTYCLRRRPDLTWEEFSRYWREVHAPLVAARADVLGIRRYVQVRTVQDPARHEALRRRNDGAPPPFDGIAEIWTDAPPGRERGEAARQAARELLDDERNFIDLPNSPLWYGEEWEVVGR